MKVQSLGLENSLEEGMATQSSILAWRIPWTEEPRGLQSVGSQEVGHYRVTNTVWKMRPCRDRDIPGRGNRTFKSLEVRRQMANLRNRPFHVAEIHIV